MYRTISGRKMSVRQEPLPEAVLASERLQDKSAGLARSPLRHEMMPLRPSTDRDNRAEGNRRTVHFDNTRIIIMRRIHGMSMRVTMPVNKYEGVGILLPNLAEGYTGFRVMLVHADPDLSVKLFENNDPLLIDAAVSEWSQFFALPALNGNTPSAGELDAGEPERKDLGALAMGEAVPMRRRGGTLAKRRPRLYARRNTGDAGRMDIVYQDEREIIAPE